MQELTIDQAAERLGMSKQAIRRLSLDEDATGSAGRRKQRFWDLAQIPAYIATSGLVIYILGLLTLGFPIHRSYTHDFATMRYAISVMPQTAVVGHGVLQLLGEPLLWSAIAVGFLALLSWTPRRVGPRRARLVTGTQQVISRNLKYLTYLSIGLVIAGGYVLGGFFLAFMYGSLFIALLALLRYVLRHPSVLGLILGKGRPHYLRMLALLFVFNFLWSLFVVATQTNEPSLPTVEISGRNTSKGTLLTHADGFWYVFDCESDCKGSRQVTLVAIPDPEVKTVQVSRSGD